MKNPEFIFFTGPMFGSKTTRLLACVDRYRIQKKSVIAFKPRMDIRYSMSKITTHNGGTLDAYVVDSSSDIFRIIRDQYGLDLPDVIAVDEAFMIDGIDECLVSLFKSGVTIVVSSLDLSSSCKPFEDIKNIMMFSTKIEKCPAVCTSCGDDAFYTHKKSSSSEEIEIGGSELYEPRCWKHHNDINNCI